MSVQLNHTIVYATDAHASAAYLAEMLDRPAPVRAGPFWQVDLDNGVALDYASAAEEEVATLPSLHLAFLVSEEQFDATYGEAKVRLAAEHAEDRMGYVRAKPAVVEPLLVDARAWAAASGR